MHPREDHSTPRPRAPKRPIEPPPGASLKRSATAPHRADPALPLSTEDPLKDLHAVNERLIELLIQAARSGEPPALALVAHLRGKLREMSPEGRSRAARRPFCLANMDFEMEREWDRGLARRNGSDSSWSARGLFPRGPALQLARSTLTLAWYSARADGATAALTFGMHPRVAQQIASLTLTEIEGLAERHFRRARPRWEDRYGLWRQILQTADCEDLRRAREVDFRGLKLMGAALMSADDP